LNTNHLFFSSFLSLTNNKKFWHSWHSFSIIITGLSKLIVHLKNQVMKKNFSSIGIVLISAVFFTACKSNANNKTADQTKILSAADAAQYQEFQQFQDWKKQQDLMNDRPVSNEVTPATNTRPVVYKTKPVYRTSAPTTTTTTTTTSKKKGWSKAAKGTAIGAAGGAIAGAIINKRNRAVGAVIGGIIGGGVGYGIGRSMDKKDGRIN
jgi:hypothetical protein